MFYFILFCNLIGIFPWTGSPTGSLMVTFALACLAFIVVIGAGMAKLGPIRYWLRLVPHMDIGGFMELPLKTMIFFIEIAGLLIRHTVLAVRLLANMFAGHLVLAVIVGFIAWTASGALWLWAGVTIPSVLCSSALTMLEIFVALLQAYIFTFLAAIFIGMAIHPH